MAYVDTWTRSDPLRRRLRRLTSGERIEEAREFLKLYHHEHGLDDAALIARQKTVVRDLQRTGSYEHSPEELAFGARVAWRNHANCIGRLWWKSLDVVDARQVVDPNEIAQGIFDQLIAAASGRNGRVSISIFAPVRGDRLPVYVESRQAIQYAGYANKSGTIGDPLNVEATRMVQALGWQPPTAIGPFDVLPLILRDANGRRLIYQVPSAAVAEVPIVHPSIAAVGTLGLRWYTVPCVCDMILSIGGIDYPCAPFTGFYMGTEIASRNLADATRYDALATVARAIGADLSDPMWKDQALLEINRAVLHSFRVAGVEIVDHHAASRHYLDFVRLEHAAGRVPSANWDWIVPPQASSACPVFHLAMTDHGDLPNFYRTRAIDGARLTPARLTEQRSRSMRRIDRVKRRLRRWWRTRG